MNHYLITLVLLGSYIEVKIDADTPFSAICRMITQIHQPGAKVSSVTCKVLT